MDDLPPMPERTPTPPNPAQDPAVGAIRPAPTPVQWAVQKIGHVTGGGEYDGEPLVLLKFWTITGEQTYFIPGSGARRIAALLMQHGTGIVLPPTGP